MKLKKLPDFRGKVVYVALAGDKRFNLTLTSPHWEDHAGRLFLVGAVPPRGSARDWCVGLLTGIAWDQITDYVVFGSLKEYHERFGAFDGKKRKS